MPNQEKTVVLSKGTHITVGLLIVIVGAIVWAANIGATTKSNSALITELQNEQKQTRIDNKEVIDRMARIEEKLNLLLEKR